MPNTPSFVEHALDLLSLVPGVGARRMFGGHGLYHRGAMFALIDDDELFFKTDAETRPRFVEAGCEPWIYESPRGPQRTSYYRPPDGAHEEPEAMLPWARLAVDAALRVAAAKAAKEAKEARAPAARLRPASRASARRDRAAKEPARRRKPRRRTRR